MEEEKKEEESAEEEATESSTEEKEETVESSDNEEETTMVSTVLYSAPLVSQNNITEAPIERYGKYIRRSRLCTICNHPHHMDINLMRARDHLSLDEISNRMRVAPEGLDIHFKNHYILSRQSKNILALREEGAVEENELFGKIIESDSDFFSILQSIQDAKARRWNMIQRRIDSLRDEQEVDGLDQFSTSEFVQLCKLVKDEENDIAKFQELIDKKLMPVNKEERVKAVLSWKYKTMSWVVDRIQIRFNEIELKPEYITTNKALIGELRRLLAMDFNEIEDEILKSGGILRPAEDTGGGNS
jgi:hypothetical protein